MEWPVAPAGWSGYFRVERSGFVTTDAFVFPPVTQATDAVMIEVLSEQAADQLFAFLAISPKSDSVQLFSRLWDCTDTPAEGAEFTASPVGANSLRWFQSGTVPDTEASATDETGGAGYFNLPAGQIHVNWRVSGVPIVEADVGFPAGRFAYFSAMPSRLIH
ncbi:MAG: hypothetical protein IPI67_07380 [Myxococcales bacterium]|nr:hypothetical protein [Myxococcales bacterium]